MMKNHIRRAAVSIAGAAVALVALCAPAATQSEKEFYDLRAQHDKAVAQAMKTVNDQYQMRLEGLTKRATQAGDLDTALMIRKEMETLGAKTADTAPDETGKQAETGKQKYTVETLPKLLAASEWSWAAKPELAATTRTRVSFTKDGSLLMLGKPASSYKITGPTTLKLDSGVLKFSDDYSSFEVSKWTDGSPRYGQRQK